MNYLKRLQRLWTLSKKDPKFLEKLDKLTVEELKVIPEEGDGNAVFFGQGTEKEYKDDMNEESGMKKWLDHLKRL